MKYYTEIQEILQTEISQLRYGENPHNLYEPIRYIMTLGGKRLRPTLVLLAHQLGSNQYSEALYPAIATEVFHNFTLMHDDIMDEAPLRRGRTTVHEHWDQTVAILSGDTMMIKAYDFMLRSDARLLPKIIDRFNQTAISVCEGQQIDMNFETQTSVSESEYMEMIRLKTASLLGFCTELGGILAGFDDKQVGLFYDMGESMGLAFQLMDDYLDVYGDQSKFGKQVGGDIISNKKTYLLIHALELADKEQLITLDSWIARKDFDPAEKVRVVRSVYDQIGIDKLTLQKMDEYIERCYVLLNTIDGSKEDKQPLMSFFNRIVNRES